MRVGNNIEVDNKEEYIDYDIANRCYMGTSILKNRIRTIDEAFYFFACMNLLNAYVKKDYAKREFKKRYIIKEYVSEGITQILESNIDGIRIFIDKGIAYIKIFDRQFSFHNITMNNAIKIYMKSKENVRQEWEGIRLQKICMTVLKESIIYRKIYSY